MQLPASTPKRAVTTPCAVIARSVSPRCKAGHRRALVDAHARGLRGAAPAPARTSAGADGRSAFRETPPHSAGCSPGAAPRRCPRPIHRAHPAAHGRRPLRAEPWPWPGFGHIGVAAHPVAIDAVLLRPAASTSSTASTDMSQARCASSAPSCSSNGACPLAIAHDDLATVAPAGARCRCGRPPAPPPTGRAAPSPAPRSGPQTPRPRSPHRRPPRPASGGTAGGRCDAGFVIALLVELGVG